MVFVFYRITLHYKWNYQVSVFSFYEQWYNYIPTSLKQVYYNKIKFKHKIVLHFFYGILYRYHLVMPYFIFILNFVLCSYHL